MTALRLFLHVLAASVWVGGQIVLAGLVPTVRTLGDDAPRQVARAFNRIAWPAFGLLVLTGIWNLFVALDDPDLADDYHLWFGIKLLLVLVSGGGAALHIVGRSKAALAIGGTMSALGSVGAMYLGFLLEA